MSDMLWAGLALMLVFEGLLPFFNPKGWREVFTRAAQLGDGQIRFMGMVSMLLGLVLLLIRGA
jgi:hypothetical protein